MMEKEKQLCEVLENLIRIRNECSCTIFSECGLSDMTVKQVSYLKLIDEQGGVSFSRLAEITRTSKPTITEMVNKFVRMECVYREPSADDRRILYIRLTEKGQKIAKAEQAAMRRVIERMVQSLDEYELEILTDLLRKVR
jgi:DNA-binding MarR family transcriptional regulator